MRSTALLAAVWSVVLSGPLEGSPESKRLRDKASELEYNLDYEEAMAAFRQAAAADPADAAAYRGVATAVWLHLQFLRGTVTVDDYLGRVSKPIMSMRQAPPDMAAAFRTNVERALALSEKHLAAMPRSADAYYQ